VYEISREWLNGFAPIHREDVFGPLISAACMWFVFGKTSLALVMSMFIFSAPPLKLRPYGGIEMNVLLLLLLLLTGITHRHLAGTKLHYITLHYIKII